MHVVWALYSKHLAPLYPLTPSFSIFRASPSDVLEGAGLLTGNDVPSFYRKTANAFRPTKNKTRDESRDKSHDIENNVCVYLKKERRKKEKSQDRKCRALKNGLTHIHTHTHTYTIHNSPRNPWNVWFFPSISPPIGFQRSTFLAEFPGINCLSSDLFFGGGARRGM